MLNIPDIILRIFFLFFYCLFPYLFIHSFALLENDLVPDGHITITVILKFFPESLNLLMRFFSLISLDNFTSYTFLNVCTTKTIKMN